MLIINAKVYFKSQVEGGLHKNGVSGMQPSFSVLDDLIMCKVVSKAGTNDFVLGEESDVSIELPYGEMYSRQIISGYRFSLNIGGKEIATGIVL